MERNLCCTLDGPEKELMNAFPFYLIFGLNILGIIVYLIPWQSLHKLDKRAHKRQLNNLALPVSLVCLMPYALALPRNDDSLQGNCPCHISSCPIYVWMYSSKWRKSVLSLNFQDMKSGSFKKPALIAEFEPGNWKSSRIEADETYREQGRDYSFSYDS